jgi:hypothetical protein
LPQSVPHSTIDADLLAEVEAILEPVRDIGWTSGRPENQDPGGQS